MPDFGYSLSVPEYPGSHPMRSHRSSKGQVRQAASLTTGVGGDNGTLPAVLGRSYRYAILDREHYPAAGPGHCYPYIEEKHHETTAATHTRRALAGHHPLQP